MPRTFKFVAGCALTLIFCLSGHAQQDSPSLGDLARQAHKDKTSAPARKVFTNDDLTSGAGPVASGPVGGLGAGLGQVAQVPPATKDEAPASPSDELDKLQALLEQVAALDHAALVKSVLQEHDVNFPGRDAWETRLVAARDVYVTQGRVLVQKARQVLSSAEKLKGTQDPNDPRVKDLTARLQQITNEGDRIGAAFQVVMGQGRDLASQAGAQ